MGHLTIRTSRKHDKETGACFSTANLGSKQVCQPWDYGKSTKGNAIETCLEFIKKHKLSVNPEKVFFVDDGRDCHFIFSENSWDVPEKFRKYRIAKQINLNIEGFKYVHMAQGTPNSQPG